MKQIRKFRGDYAFLSNFYECDLIVDHIYYANAEAAFQAQKIPEYKLRRKFSYLLPTEAKKIGKTVQLRNDWKKIKFDMMYLICKAKFTQNPDLREKLLATEDAELAEENTWGDTVWGISNGKGDNHLGKILMRVRKEIRESYDNWTTDIIDTIEDLLYDYNITIPSNFEPGEENDARIYGEPYFRIRMEVGNILRRSRDI